MPMTLRIPPGVFRGESRASLPGRWYDTNLIRWNSGLMVPVGGWERINSAPLLSIPRRTHVMQDSVGNRHMGILCDGRVYREEGSSYTNITPSGFVDANSSLGRGYGSGLFGQKDYGMDDEERGTTTTVTTRPVNFCLDSWTDFLLFQSSADGRLFRVDMTTATAPAAVPSAPALMQGFVITDEGHLMVYGTAGEPNRIEWSGQENFSDWDFAAVTGSAGFYPLEGPGVVFAHAKIPGGILFFTSTAVWLCRYIGAPYYYGFTKIAEGCSPISAQAIAVAGSRAFWMGTRSFWKFEGGIVTSLPHTLGHTPFEGSEMDVAAAPRRVTAGFNGMYPEIWFFYPSVQGLSPISTENDRYIVYNFEANWWANGYVGRSVYSTSPIDGFPIAGDEQTYLYQHEIGYSAEGAPRGEMVFGELGTISPDDGASNWYVKQAQTDSDLGPQSVRFDFTGRRVRGGPRVPLQSNVSPRADGFLDLHFTARDFSLRIEGVEDGPWSLGAMVLDATRRGRV